MWSTLCWWRFANTAPWSPGCGAEQQSNRAEGVEELKDFFWAQYNRQFLRFLLDRHNVF